MGLSDEERISGIFNCIHSLNEVILYNDIDDSVKIFIDRINKSALSTDSNSTFWILGGGASNLHKESNPSTPIGEALQHSARMLFPSSLEEMDKSFKAKQSKVGAWFFEFTPVTICQLLPKNLRVYLNIYNICESFLYFSNRYTDDVSNNWRHVSEVISSLMLECAHILRQDEHLALAWVASRALEMVYPWCSPVEDDPVLRLSAQFYVHHNFSVEQIDSKVFKELCSLRKAWDIEFEKKKSRPVACVRKRLLLLLKLTDSKFLDYSHQIVEAIKLFDCKDRGFVEKRLNHRVKNKKKSTPVTRSTWCWITDGIVHG